jgi:hypothetical protein
MKTKINIEIATATGAMTVYSLLRKAHPDGRGYLHHLGVSWVLPPHRDEQDE